MAKAKARIPRRGRSELNEQGYQWAMSVDCPECKQIAGVECITKNGLTAVTPHSVRMRIGRDKWMPPGVAGKIGDGLERAIPDLNNREIVKSGHKINGSSY